MAEPFGDERWCWVRSLTSLAQSLLERFEFTIEGRQADVDCLDVDMGITASNCSDGYSLCVAFSRILSGGRLSGTVEPKTTQTSCFPPANPF